MNTAMTSHPPESQPLLQPVFILVRPQLPENVGAVARAMANMGFNRLRLVNPCRHWDGSVALAVSAGADWVLTGAQVFSTVEAAIADLAVVIATTDRNRYLNKPFADLPAAAVQMHDHLQNGTPLGILFGPERTGLENADIAPANQMVSIPSDPHFSSLNLAQAVLVVAWQLRLNSLSDPAGAAASIGSTSPPAPLAPKADLDFFLQRLGEKLVAAGFIDNLNLHRIKWRKIQNLFQKTPYSQGELYLLQGILTALTSARLHQTEGEAKGEGSTDSSPPSQL
jgi:tRNA/rRNA methyltransferase